MTRNQKKAIVLMSGGMDSTVCAAIARDMGYTLAALHVNYQQRTQEREKKSFHDVAGHYGITERLEVDISYLAAIGGSSLTDQAMEVPQADLQNLEVPNTYVPFRNANMLAIATSWAEINGASCIVIGAVQEDSSGYPDCRQEFYDAFQKVIDTGTKPDTRIKILTPIIFLSKKEIVLKGIELGAPFHLSWSCYKAEEAACGECDSCALRLRGFHEAGFTDPLPYQNRPQY